MGSLAEVYAYMILEIFTVSYLYILIGHGKIENCCVWVLRWQFPESSLSKVKTDAKRQLQRASDYLPNQAVEFGTIENLQLWFCGKAHCFCLPESAISILMLGCVSLLLQCLCSPWFCTWPTSLSFSEFPPDYHIYLYISVIFHLLMISL